MYVHTCLLTPTAFLRGELATDQASRLGESLAHLLTLRRDRPGRDDDPRLPRAAALHRRVTEQGRRQPEVLLPHAHLQQVRLSDFARKKTGFSSEQV